MSSSTLEREWKPGDPCPCGCSIISMKLSPKTWHVRGCSCHPCQGRRNRAKGRRAQARAQREFGSTKPFTHAHEELDGAYDIPIRFEAKAGGQVPAYFLRFVHSEWFRRALSQAERATPVGEESYASVYMEPPREGAWLVVKIR